MAAANAKAMHAVLMSDDGEYGVDERNFEIIKKYLRRPAMGDRDSQDNAVPKEEMAYCLRNCKIIVKFYDSLYNATNPAIDTARLRQLLAGEALVIKKFYGHLGQAGITLLPRSVKELCLAIGNATDAELVSSLRPWPGLNELRVSVTPRVAVEDLRPLPKVWQRGIIFPILTDARVSIVEPAITALITGNKHLTALFFPKAMLTSAGARHLIETIREMEALDVDYVIIIDPCGTWKPDKEEKEMLGEKLKTKVRAGQIEWDTVGV